QHRLGQARHHHGDAVGEPEAHRLHRLGGQRVIREARGKASERTGQGGRHGRVLLCWMRERSPAGGGGASRLAAWPPGGVALAPPHVRVPCMPAATPLRDITVIELGHSVAAPYAAEILGDLGATVMKIEKRDGGDDARKWAPPYWHGVSAIFQSLNRNK